MSKNEVAARASTAVGAVVDYGEYQGQGFEHQSQKDIAIPFIAVLQALSPQVEKMPGAKAGMLYNTVTEELHKSEEGLLFIPAVTQHCYVEWVPRAKGGGFVGIHAMDSDVVKQATEDSKEFGRLKVGKLAEGTAPKDDPRNDLMETFYIYGVLADDTNPVGMAVLAFTSTKIKVYKKFNTKVRTHLVQVPSGARINPPLFANLTRVRSFKDKNPKGEFYNFELVPAVEGDLKKSLLNIEDPRFQAAVDCKKAVESGVARAAFDTQSKAGDGDSEEKIPF